MEKSLRHKPLRKPSSLLYLLFPNDNSLMFFLTNVKVDLGNKVIGFQFEPEGAYLIIKDSSKTVVMKKSDMFNRKDCNPSVWCKCRNCYTMKTKK